MTPTPEPASNETRIRRRLVGLFLFPLALFPLLALMSYDWRCIAELNVPPLSPTTNLIGPAGDWFAWNGYRIFGLAIWAVPVLCVAEGLLLVCGRSFHPGRRAIGLVLFAFSATCLLQLFNLSPVVAELLHEKLNLADAGGSLGYLVMNCALSGIVSPFGAAVLMSTLLLFALFIAIGPGEICGAMRRLAGWAKDEPLTPEEAQAREEKRRQEEQQREALRAAREEAKRQKEEEKRRIAEEKEREREEKRRAKEEAKARIAAERERDEPPSILDSMFTQPSNASAPQSATAPQPTSQAATKASPQTPADAQSQAEAAPAVDKGPYMLPPVSLLNPPSTDRAEHGDVNIMAQKLIDTLNQFGIETTLAFTVPGPVVTQYALVPAPTVRVERIPALSGNLQMALEAKSLRIQAPIPGKNAVGIEVPNAKPCGVAFGDIVRSETWQKATAKMAVPLLLGKDAAGNDLVTDLATLPHLLVAGATGQGKSVCLNSIINGLLMCRTPEQLKLIMVDPKRVEFTNYVSLPHLLVPVVNDTKKVVFALRWAVMEMEKRLKLFGRAHVRNIADYNSRKVEAQPDLFGAGDETSNPDMPRTIPYIAIIIDEVADIMQTAGKEVEPVIARLTALARATGIHLILATQRPDAKIITGVIKSNIPGRIAFKTSSSIDSRTILDDMGAEDLIGRGDMLFRTKEGLLLRAQGSFISDPEVDRIVKFIGEHSSVAFDEKFAARIAKIKEADPEDVLAEGGEEDGSAGGGDGGDGVDPLSTTITSNGVPPPSGMGASKEEELYQRAVEVVRLTNRASTSHLQRRMGIGYNHAARLIDLLEDRGIIGPARGAGPREILVDLNAQPATDLESITQTPQMEESSNEPRTDFESGS